MAVDIASGPECLFSLHFPNLGWRCVVFTESDQIFTDFLLFFFTTKSKMKRALPNIQHSLSGLCLDDVGHADMSQAHSPPLRDNMKESDWRCCVSVGHDDMAMMLHCYVAICMLLWKDGMLVYEDVVG